MSYRRPYYVYDANFDYVGRVWLDLSDPVLHQRVLFDDDLTRSLGPQRQIERGRVTEEIRRGNVDAGVWQKGEAPHRSTRSFRPGEMFRADDPRNPPQRQYDSRAGGRKR